MCYCTGPAQIVKNFKYMYKHMPYVTAKCVSVV